MGLDINGRVMLKFWCEIQSSIGQTIINAASSSFVSWSVCVLENISPLCRRNHWRWRAPKSGIGSVLMAFVQRGMFLKPLLFCLEASIFVVPSVRRLLLQTRRYWGHVLPRLAALEVRPTFRFFPDPEWTCHIHAHMYKDLKDQQIIQTYIKEPPNHW